MDQRTDAVSGSDDTHAIRRDIERTQREMSRTIEEIQSRLSPQNMMQRTKDSVREAGVRTSRNFIDKIKANPIPAAMVGIGLFLLARNNDDESSIDLRPDSGLGRGRDASTFSSAAEYRDLEPSAAGAGRLDEARERVSEAAHEARERVSHAMDTARERVESWGTSTRDGARRAGVQSADFMRQNPLAAGLVAVALGAIVGSLIPETDREHELMGATRDRLADRARDLTREGVDHAKDIAGDVATAATGAAKEAVRKATKNDVPTNIGIG
ncbi:MAG TPA: DUF3618 domain-containing protein [Thermoanaerobaculia bacterium]|nr:DUF3618 domain-containing protein [Thermoanaerobaculia bacterium]